MTNGEKMLSFKEHAASQYLVEEANTHMTHIQDMVLYGGVEGTRAAIVALRDIRDTLAGKDMRAKATVKLDGAPAIFFGQVPDNEPDAGKFFVAKKGLFNKVPKYYTTPADIDADTSGELAEKLKLCLAELPSIGGTGIYQGDMMFSNSDLKKERISGKDYVTFHPNTIVYSVPAGSPLANKMLNSKMGIVIHTKYEGQTFKGLKASYNVKESEFSRSSSVWYDDANVKNMNGIATMSADQTKAVTDQLASAGRSFNKISSTLLRDLQSNKAIAQLIEQYNNSLVRGGVSMPTGRKHVMGLYAFIRAKYTKEIAKYKTQASKDKKTKEMNSILVFVQKYRSSFVNLFELQRSLTNAKLLIIKKLNEINSIDTFIKTRNGFKVTGQEGYVLVAGSGKSMKLIDQLEFSRANFSSDVLKGWEK